MEFLVSYVHFISHREEDRKWAALHDRASRSIKRNYEREAAADRALISHGSIAGFGRILAPSATYIMRSILELEANFQQNGDQVIRERVAS